MRGSCPDRGQEGLRPGGRGETPLSDASLFVEKDKVAILSLLKSACCFSSN